MLGDFDFNELRKANRVLGPILFISFIVLIFFCLLNMFMAVIMKAYDEVVDELAKQPDELSSSIRKQIKRTFARLFRSKKKMMAALVKRETTAQREKQDPILTEKDLAEIFDMEREQFVRMGILNPRYLVALADTDMDGAVSVAELKKLQEDAAEAAKIEEKELTVEEVLEDIQEEQRQQRAQLSQLTAKLRALVAAHPGSPAPL